MKKYQIVFFVFLYWSVSIVKGQNNIIQRNLIQNNIHPTLVYEKATSLDSLVGNTVVNRNSIYQPEAINIWTEDFNSDPINRGWQNYGFRGINTGNTPDTNGVWEYRGTSTLPASGTGSRGAYASGTTAIQSPTRTNGFMIFDSDWLDNNGSPTGTGVLGSPHRGMLISPSVDLSSHDFVNLSFYQYYRRFGGPGGAQSAAATYLLFSTDDGLTWSDTLALNSSIAVNSSTSSSLMTRINVSPYIGGQDSVKIAFLFNGDYYFWMVDDIAIEQAPRVDMAITGTAFLPDTAAGRSIEYGMVPDANKTPLTFQARVANIGSTVRNNIRLQVSVIDTTAPGTPLFTGTSAILSSLNPFTDTLLSISTTYTPNLFKFTRANYSLTFDSVTMDSTANNTASRQFELTDSILALNVSFPTSQLSFGTRNFVGNPPVYDIKIANICQLVSTDTVTSATARLVNSGTSTSQVGGLLYFTLETGDVNTGLPGGTGSVVLETDLYTLTAADLSIGRVTVPFPSTLGGSPQERIVNPGEYWLVAHLLSNNGSNHISLIDDQTVTMPWFATVLFRSTYWFHNGNAARMSLNFGRSPYLSISINHVNSPNICFGDSLLMTTVAGSGFSYQWKRNGIDIPGATSSSYSATISGTYSVFVTNSSGAAGLSPGVVVTVSPLPAPVISPVGSTNLCMGGRVRLNATLVNGVSYQWTRNGVDIPGMVLGTLEAFQSGNYAVKVTRGACQSVSNTIQVTVNPTCQGISLGMVQTCQDDTIEVPIYQNGLQAISAMNLRFSYNPNHLVYLGHTVPVSPLSTMGVNQVMVNSQQAWVNLNWVDLTPQNLATGDILKIRFRAISNTTLEWDTLISPAEVLDFNLNPIPLVYTSSSVVVYNSPSLQFIQRTICEGQSVNIAGQTFNTSGTFNLGTVPSTSFSTCDSNFQLQLLVIPRINDLGSVSICQGQTYTFRGRVLNTTGIYYDTLINFLGCDSLIKLNLTVNPTYDQIQTRVICQGSCFYFGGQNRCSSGTFNYNYLSLNGCDSTVTLHLMVSDSLVLQSNSGSNGICPGGQISLGSQQPWPTGGIPIWFQNGIQLSGINDSILNVQAAGAYQLRIYIPSGNCSLYSNVFSVVQLNCNKVSGNLRYDNSLNTPLAGVPIHLKTLLGNIIASDTSDSSGYYELTGYQNGNYVLDASINYLPGGVNSTDALFVQRHFTSLITLSALRRSAGDVNGSSVTNGTDALLIQRWSTGVISVMPAGTFTTDRPTLNAIGNPIVMNMKALSYGDVNGSYNPPPRAPVLVLDSVYGNGNVGTAVVRFTTAGSGVFERGIVWSSSPNPTLTSNKSTAGTGGFGFTHSFSSIDPNNIQYARAYARTSAGVYYSPERSFTPIPGLRCPGTPTVTDIDGNVYNSVQIGNQCWTQSNLKTSKYRNGDSIPTGLNNSQWSSKTSGAYTIYNNDPVNDGLYGKLYNHYAVTDSRGLCPTGWHVPSDSEWTALENQLGGSSVAGGALKSEAMQPTLGGWVSPNMGATNSSGFSALPGGIRYYYGDFSTITGVGVLWSSSVWSGSNAWIRLLTSDNSLVYRSNFGRTSGLSVRCVRD